MVKLKTVPTPKLAKERADRIQKVRKFLGLSRSKLCAKYQKLGLTENALSGWENIRWYGLTENGATILAKAFQEEGLAVTVEWLMYGVGDSPISSARDLPAESSSADSVLPDQELIAKELDLFKQHYKNAIDVVITDEALKPWLNPGDTVAGVRYVGDEIENAIGHVSIVQTDKGNILVRTVQPGKDLGFYNLTAFSHPTKFNVTDVKLVSAAPIIWIRKKVL